MFKGRIRFRVGIALAFILAMAPLTLGMVGYLYWSNSKLIVQSTANTMQRVSAGVSRDVQNLILPAARLLQSTAEIVRTDHGSLQRVQGLEFFYRQIKDLPQIFSITRASRARAIFTRSFVFPKT
ncbi:MAG: hypothetical protein JKY20_07120 [Alphaproteobacteria bacterium]|nr:hypothetical protein [Alphaproteobacteria bacterium]